MCSSRTWPSRAKPGQRQGGPARHISEGSAFARPGSGARIRTSVHADSTIATPERFATRDSRHASRRGTRSRRIAPPPRWLASPSRRETPGRRHVRVDRIRRASSFSTSCALRHAASRVLAWSPPRARTKKAKAALGATDGGVAEVAGDGAPLEGRRGFGASGRGNRRAPLFRPAAKSEQAERSPDHARRAPRICFRGGAQSLLCTLFVKCAAAPVPLCHGERPP